MSTSSFHRKINFEWFNIPHKFITRLALSLADCDGSPLSRLFAKLLKNLVSSEKVFTSPLIIILYY